MSDDNFGIFESNPRNNFLFYLDMYKTFFHSFKIQKKPSQRKKEREAYKYPPKYVKMKNPMVSPPPKEKKRRRDGDLEIIWQGKKIVGVFADNSPVPIRENLNR